MGRASLPKIDDDVKTHVYALKKKYYADMTWDRFFEAAVNKMLQYDREKPALDKKQRVAGAILQDQRMAEVEADQIAQAWVREAKYETMSFFDEVFQEFGTESFARLPDKLKQHMVLEKKQKLRRILDLKD